MGRHSSMKIEQKCGRLTLLEKFKKKSGKSNRSYGKFRCDCGTEKDIEIYPVKKGIVVSCGCYQKEQAKLSKTTHGQSVNRTGAYETWRHMKDRCLNNKTGCYLDYGGRGIKIDEKWLKFENFLSDMGNRPKGKTLDRIDNNKGYYKENCRWATYEQQANNRRNTRFLIYNGKRQSVKQWADELGIKYSSLRGRLDGGQSLERALNPAKQNERFLEYGGERLTIMQWAKKLNINPKTIRTRLSRKYPMDKILR